MPARSWLFVPGDSPRKMEKALGAGADALILDLEDSVAPEARAEARDRVAGFLDTVAAIPRFVRVNALATGLTAADVAATGGRADGFVLPKCEGADDLETLAGLTGGKPRGGRGISAAVRAGAMRCFSR